MAAQQGKLKICNGCVHSFPGVLKRNLKVWDLYQFAKRDFTLTGAFIGFDFSLFIGISEIMGYRLDRSDMYKLKYLERLERKSFSEK